jgi:hypothetical protein
MSIGAKLPTCDEARRIAANIAKLSRGCSAGRMFNERSGLDRICPVKIAKRDDRRAAGIEDIKARVEVPPIGHPLHFSNSVLHWLCLRLVALGQA